MGPMTDEPPSDEAAEPEASAGDDTAGPQDGDGEAAAGPQDAEDSPEDAAGPQDAADSGAERRFLRRSADDRMIAGVAGGIGAYFGIDPVIVRVGFIVLTFLGGAGPFLYLLGWLALPREESRSVIASALAGESPRRFRGLLAVVLIGMGLLIVANLSGEFFELFFNVWTNAPYLALILIAAGAALVLWPGPAGRSEPASARPPTAPPPPAPPHPQGGRAEAVGHRADRPIPPVTARARRRGRTTIGYLTVAVLLVYTGGAVLLDRLDAVEVDVGVFFAVALAIVGVGLVGSAFAVPARGLILLGVALSVPVLLFAGSGVRWGSGIGEIRVDIADADELRDEYRHGVGRMVVDLRGFDPDDAAARLDLSLGVGEMLVYVRDDIKTTADIHVGAGSIRVAHGVPASGRVRDLYDSRNILEDLWALPVGVLDDLDDLDDIEDYLDADEYAAVYETHIGWRLQPEQIQPLARLLSSEAGLEDRQRAREVVLRLLLEARAMDYQREVTDDGVGLDRRISTPPGDGSASDLRLDIDIGIGKAEVVALPATGP